MKIKIFNFLSIIYNVLKTEYWPYRYYILLYVVFITTFTMDMITISRMVRFLITCLVILVYKKLKSYIDNKKMLKINVKILIFLIWINTLQNPIIYLIWKWDLYVYYKIKNYIDKYINYWYINNIFTWLFWNITAPIKFIYLRFYMTLNLINKSTFQEIMFHRIYGLILSILIFSNIIQYIYKITGGLLNTIIYIYIIIYSINLIYIVYYYLLNKKFKDSKNKKKIQNFVLKIIEKTLFFKIVKDYFEIIKIIEINEVFKAKIKVSLVVNYIKHNITDLANNLNFIPEQWRFWIFEYYKQLFNNPVFYVSYIDMEILANITNLKMTEKLKDMLDLSLINKRTKGDIIYMQAMFSMSDLFVEFESVLYYKYCVLKKGIQKKYSNINTSQVIYSKYQEIYEMNLLILKMMVFFIWDFEYAIFKDTNKITKWYVIQDVNLEYGYHIYPKDIDNYNPHDSPILNVQIEDFELYAYKNKNNPEFYILNNDIIFETIYVLSNLEAFKLFSTPSTSSLLYIHYESNKMLKEIIRIQNKFSYLMSWQENDLSLLEENIAQAYFNELKNVMDSFDQEWKHNCDKESNQHRQVFLELIKHYKNTKWEND